MATFTAAQVATSNRVRREWQGFHRSHSAGRAALDHKVEALKAQADTEYSRNSSHSRVPQSAHDSTKAKLIKELREKYFDGLRSQWQTKLNKAGLKDEQWIDMSVTELNQIYHLLGNEDESDEDMVYVAPPTKPVAQAHAPSPYYTPSAVAPSISTSTRVTNASNASSYAFVNPSEFHSEEEDYFFNPHMTSHEATSDEDEGAASASSLPSRRRMDPFGSWSDNESHLSSMHNSVHSGYESSSAARPLVSDFAYNSRTTTSSKQAGQAKGKAPEKSKEKEPSSTMTPGTASASKATVDRASYIGPTVDDPEDNLSDEDEFERFKMRLRFQKIAEFHQAAALAEIQLSVKIYRSRKAGEKHVVSGLLAEHQKSMSQLQTTKEDERKALVDKERSRRRSELRRRPGRSNTILAPTPSAPTNPVWLHTLEDNTPDEVQAKFDLDKLLSGDPDNSNVDQLLQHMLSEAASNRPAPGRGPVPMSSHNSTQSFSSPGSEFQTAAFEATAAIFEPKARWTAQGTSAASHRVAHQQQQNASTGSSASASFSHMNRRRESDAARYKQTGRGSTKPSPFGEDESSSDDEEEVQQKSPPPSRGNPMRTNPFANARMSARVVDELQTDPEIARALEQYAGIALPQQSPPMPSWGSRLAAQTPSVPSGYMPKESPLPRGPPVSSGWGRRNPGAATPQPQISQDSYSSYNSSTVPARNPYSFADEAHGTSGFASNGFGDISAKVRGKKATVAPEEQGTVWERAMAAKAPQAQEEQESLWEMHNPKANVAEGQQAAWGRSSTMPQQNSERGWGNQSSMFASEDRQSTWGKKPVSASDEMQMQMGWGRNTAPVEEPDPMQAAWGDIRKSTSNSPEPPVSKFGANPPPVPSKMAKAAPPPPPPAPASKKQAKKQRLNKKGAMEEPEPTAEYAEDAADFEPSPAMDDSAPDAPESMFSSTVTSIGRMIPGIGRKRMDSFGGWEEAATTPRQPSKMPAHLAQESSAPSFKADATPRPGFHKKADSTNSPLSQGTIKGSMWGAAAAVHAPPAQRGGSLWSMFSGGDSKSAQAEMKSVSPERDPQVPGGFDGGEEEADYNDGEQNEAGGWDEYGNGAAASDDAFWTPTEATKKPTPAPPAMSAAAQRMSLGTESPVAAAAKATPAKAAATPIQPPAKKGKKGKNAMAAKKAFVEEVPDEEPMGRGERLPVDSHSILEDSQPILEPRPSVPSKQYDSIISYTDEEGEEGTFAPQEPPVAAGSPEEFQETPTAAGAGASIWGAGNNTKKAAEPEKPQTPPAPPAAPAKPAWGQTGGGGGGKKGKKGRK